MFGGGTVIRRSKQEINLALRTNVAKFIFSPIFAKEGSWFQKIRDISKISLSKNQAEKKLVNILIAGDSMRCICQDLNPVVLNYQNKTMWNVSFLKSMCNKILWNTLRLNSRNGCRWPDKKTSKSEIDGIHASGRYEMRFNMLKGNVSK